MPQDEQLRDSKQPLLSVPMKAGIVGGGTTGLTGYLALWLFQKWGVPIELTSLAVAAVGGLAGRWAGKLQP